MSDDDVWGEECSDDGMNQEARARQASFHNAGYREAIEEGKARTLQHGFDIGFKEGARAGLSWGTCSAQVQTLAIFTGQVAGTSQVREQIAQLTKTLESIPPRQLMISAFKKILSAPPSDSDRPVQLRVKEGCDSEFTSTATERTSERQQQIQEGRGELSGAAPALPSSSIGQEMATEDEIKQALDRLPEFILDNAIPFHQQQDDLPDVETLIMKVKDSLKSMGFHPST